MALSFLTYIHRKKKKKKHKSLEMSNFQIIKIMFFYKDLAHIQVYKENDKLESKHQDPLMLVLWVFCKLDTYTDTS